MDVQLENRRHRFTTNDTINTNETTRLGVEIEYPSGLYEPWAVGDNQVFKELVSSGFGSDNFTVIKYESLTVNTEEEDEEQEENDNLWNGLEVVSKPASLPFHQSSWAQLNHLQNFYPINDRLVEDECGTHVHISGDIMPDYRSLYEFCKLNASWLSKVGRDSIHSRFTGRDTLSRTANSRNLKCYCVEPSGEEDERNANFEFRFFPATTNRQKLLSYIEITDAIFRFISEDQKHQSAQFEEFVRYIQGFGGRYHNLLSRMVTLGLPVQMPQLRELVRT